MPSNSFDSRAPRGSALSSSNNWKKISNWFGRAIVLTALFFGFVLNLWSLENPGENLQKVGLDTELGTQLDLTRVFTDQSGASKPLGEFLLPERPIVFVPAYYHCPRLCGLLLSGAKKVFEAMNLKVGSDYQVVTISFDPKDTPQMAEKQFNRFGSELVERSGNPNGWKFLVGTQTNIDSFMGSLGFRYQEDKGEYAHTAAIFVATPAGEISQYFANIEFSPSDVRLAIVEAGRGMVGTVLDQVLLYCFRFDPSKGKYTWAAFGLMRAGGGVTFLVLFGLILWLRNREVKKKA